MWEPGCRSVYPSQMNGLVQRRGGHVTGAGGYATSIKPDYAHRAVPPKYVSKRLLITYSRITLRYLVADRSEAGRRPAAS